MKIEIPRKIVELFEQSQKVGIITHARSDGDAFGALLALREILQNIGKEVVCFSNEEIPGYLEFLKNKTQVDFKKSYEEIDLLVCLDANSPERLTMPEIFTRAYEEAKVVVIDHHLGGDFEDYLNLVCLKRPEVSSTCELIFELSCILNLRLGRLESTLLYLGVISDTGFLQFKNTSEHSIDVAAELLKTGADAREVGEALRIGSQDLANSKLTGVVLKRLIYNKKYDITVTYITQKDLTEYGQDEGFGSGLANFLDQTKEGRAVFVLMETKDGQVKVSMRSNRSGAPVSKLAEFFGGGGHTRAAGFFVPGKIADLK